MFDPTLRSRLGSAERQDAFYGRGWLLTHYLTFKPERYREFQQYLRLLNSGTPSVAAAEQSFGDLGALSIEVDRYLAGSRMPAMTMMYDGNVLPAATVTWNFAEDMQLRLSASQTIARPQFRELAPQQFVDVDMLGRQATAHDVVRDGHHLDAQPV